MERQNNRAPRTRKPVARKREETPASERFTPQDRTPRRERVDEETSRINGLSRYGLNDLYERSSI